MNIISFEERTFEGIAAKFEYFVQRVDNLCRRHGEKKIDEWMDNHDVCRKRCISPRTLQDYRNSGILSYIQVGGKNSLPHLRCTTDNNERIQGGVSAEGHLVFDCWRNK